MATATRGSNEVQPARGDFLAMLERSRGEIGKLLADPRKVDRVVRIVRTAYLTKPEVRRCTGESIIMAVLKACELDLEPDGAMHDGYLIAYKDQCQFQPSYRGLVKLARRSGEYRVIDARPVHSRDTFDVQFDPHPKLRHIPCLAEDRGTVTHAYAYATLNNGAEVLRVVNRAEIEAARRQSKAPNSLMWTQFYEEAAMKTVLKKFTKAQPCSVEMARAIEIDDEIEGGGGAEPRGLPPGRGTAGLARALGVAEAQAEPEFTEGTSGQVVVEDETPGREPGEEG
jgi:recombination protein RecT